MGWRLLCSGFMGDRLMESEPSWEIATMWTNTGEHGDFIRDWGIRVGLYTWAGRGVGLST